MTCQECELKLGLGENASDHLAFCAECRALAEDLRLNTVALREMRARPAMRWAWVMAAAAAVVLSIAFWRVKPVEKPPQRTAAVQIATPPTGVAPKAAVAPKRARKRRQPAESLRVKMFTSDPDVVIYWIVDKKEGSE